MRETRTLRDEYFDWLCSKVKDRNHRYHKKLLRKLYFSPFEYILDMDANRYSDGVDLRYRFAYQEEKNYAYVATVLDIYPCSILEMMIALALRCEGFMSDPTYGNRASEWFWSMVRSLGLDGMTDGKYDADRVDDILQRFINREYHPNGTGGLFTLRDPLEDLRRVEIWYQAMWYFNEIIEQEQGG